MLRAMFVVTLALVSHIALAGAPALVPFKGSNLTVSFPKGWAVAQQDTIYVAQQDAKKTDAAAIMFIYTPNATNATEDALLDAMTNQIAKDAKVTQRAAVKGGVGHYVFADGTMADVKVRLVAIAANISGQSVICLFVSKVGDFDKLGGMTLAMNVMGSLKPDAPAAPPPAAAAPAPAPAPAASGGKLTAPAPGRVLAASELAGTWTQDDHVLSSYVSSSTGAYAGYSAISTTEKWDIDAKGGIAIKFNATTASSGSRARQVEEKSAGTVSITSDNVLVIKKPTQQQPTQYVIRGWEVRSDITVMKLNGPFYDAVDKRVLADPTYATNLDHYWVRVSAKTK